MLWVITACLSDFLEVLIHVSNIFSLQGLDDMLATVDRSFCLRHHGPDTMLSGPFVSSADMSKQSVIHDGLCGADSIKIGLNAVRGDDVFTSKLVVEALLARVEEGREEDEPFVRKTCIETLQKAVQSGREGVGEDGWFSTSERKF